MEVLQSLELQAKLHLQLPVGLNVAWRSQNLGQAIGTENKTTVNEMSIFDINPVISYIVH